MHLLYLPLTYFSQHSSIPPHHAAYMEKTTPTCNHAQKRIHNHMQTCMVVSIILCYLCLTNILQLQNNQTQYIICIFSFSYHPINHMYFQFQLPPNKSYVLSHQQKKRLPSSPISRETVGTATNEVFSRGSADEPRPNAWAQGARGLQSRFVARTGTNGVETFSPGSCHEPVLKVPFSNSTPPPGIAFSVLKKIKENNGNVKKIKENKFLM